MSYALFRPPLSERKFCLHAPRANRADLDPARAQFLIQSLRETDLGELGHAIHGFSAKAVNPGHRGNHQDGDGTLRQHQGHRMPREQECRADIGIHHFVIFRGGGIHEVLIIDSGIVYQDVEPPKRVLGDRGCLAGSLLFPRVSYDDFCLAPSGLNFCRQDVQSLLATRGEDEPGSFGRKSSRAGLPDTRARASDQGALST